MVYKEEALPLECGCSEKRLHGKGGLLKMSICDSGMGSKVSGDCVSIIIDDTHPLVILSNKLPWHDLHDLIT